MRVNGCVCWWVLNVFTMNFVTHAILFFMKWMTMRKWKRIFFIQLRNKTKNCFFLFFIVFISWYLYDLFSYYWPLCVRGLENIKCNSCTYVDQRFVWNVSMYFMCVGYTNYLDFTVTNKSILSSILFCLVYHTCYVTFSRRFCFRSYLIVGVKCSFLRS